MAKKKDFTIGELDKLFSVPNRERTAEVVRSIAKPEKPAKQRKIDTQKVFSFRAEKETVDGWRVWADAKGMKVDELGEKAITEYIKRHALDEDQQKIYDLKLAQKKA